MRLKPETLKEVKRAYRRTRRPVWKAIYEMLEAPIRRERRVNVSKLDKIVPEGATVIVPGKVLGSGIVTKKMTVVALDFSKSAVEKIKKAGGKAVPLSSFVKKNAKKKGLIIVGG